jgi:hypothetical protein
VWKPPWIKAAERSMAKLISLRDRAVNFCGAWIA